MRTSTCLPEATPSLSAGKEDLNIFSRVDNVIRGFTSHPSFPLSFLLEAGEIAAPYLKEENSAIDDDGISFRFAPAWGPFYYTLDGSEPTNPPAMTATRWCWLGGGRVKAICKRGGSVSGVHERNIPYAAAVKAKAK